MPGLGWLRSPFALAAQRPSYPKAVAAALISTVLVVAGFLAGAFALFGINDSYFECAEGASDEVDERRCAEEILPRARAQFFLAFFLVTAFALLAWPAAWAAPSFVVGAFERGRRDVVVQDRLRRLEDAYMDGLLPAETYHSTKDHFIAALAGELPGDRAREESRMLAWTAWGAGPSLAITLYFASFLLETWVSLSATDEVADELAATALVLAPVLWGALITLSISSWREARAAVGAGTQKTERLWQEVLDQSRSSSLEGKGRRRAPAP